MTENDPFHLPPKQPESEIFPFVRPFSEIEAIESGLATMALRELAQHYFDTFQDPAHGELALEVSKAEPSGVWYSATICIGDPIGFVQEALGIESDPQTYREFVQLCLYAYNGYEGDLIEDYTYFTDKRIGARRFNNVERFFNNAEVVGSKHSIETDDGVVVLKIDGKRVTPEEYLDHLNRVNDDIEEKLDLEERFGFQKQPVSLIELVELRQFMGKRDFAKVN